MDPVLQSDFLRALGWSLLDSMWQLGLIWLLYIVLTGNGKRFTATVRHNLAIILLASGSLWFLLTIVLRCIPGNSSSVFPIYRFPDTLLLSFETLLPWVSVGYLGITFCMMARFFRQVRFTRQLSITGIRKASPEIRVFLRELAGSMGIKKPVSIWLSNLVETPLTIGFWKPIILLPVSIVNNLSLQQTEAIILHELYHIQRNDFLLNLVIATADVILYFNPFATFLKEIIQREREHCCDDIVIQFRYAPGIYAQALLLLEQQRGSATPGSNISIAATGNHRMFLLSRVKRILTGETPRTPVNYRLAGFFFISLLIGYLGHSTKPVPDVLHAQSFNPFTAASSSDTELYPAFTTDPAEQTVDKIVADAPAAIQGDMTDDLFPLALQEEVDSREMKGPANEPGLNVEKDFAQVLVTGKLEEMMTEAATQPVTEFVASPETREFTITIDAQPDKETELPATTQPYVPSSSFLYKDITDSIHHKRVTIADLNAQVQLAKTLAAIDEINWSRVEKDLHNAGEKLDVERLEFELKKAVAELDWKKLNTDLENAGRSSATEVNRYREQLADKYLRYEKAKAKRADEVREAHRAIILERHATPRASHRKATKAKKIVNI